jgi:hypothetical protein
MNTIREKKVLRVKIAQIVQKAQKSQKSQKYLESLIPSRDFI